MKKKMVIKNGNVLNSNFSFEKTDVTIEGDLIQDIGVTCGCDIDATDCYVVPGFIDTHIHGGGGEDFLFIHNGTFEKISQYHAQNGTTSLVATLAAAPENKMMDAVRNLREVQRKQQGCATLLGVHLEGPFFSEVYKGAHLPENIRNADAAELARYMDGEPEFIKVITLAPEIPGADETIVYAAKNGVSVSVGHTNATMDETKHAADLGAKRGTHTFNAMRGINHREPGTVGGILFSDLSAELICDFFHVHPEMIQMVYRLKGRDKIILITDCGSAAGLGDGEHVVNGRNCIVKDGRCYTEDGVINGSTICLIDAVRNLVSIGIPLNEACMMASKNPAVDIGVYDTVGSIEPRKQADLVILDQQLNIRQVILRGKLI